MDRHIERTDGQTYREDIWTDIANAKASCVCNSVKIKKYITGANTNRKAVKSVKINTSPVIPVCRSC